MAQISDPFQDMFRLILSQDATLFQIVQRSLSVSSVATFLACVVGLLFGAWLGVVRFRGRGLVLLIINSALAVPSVVVGLVVYLVLSRSGPLGHWGWLFSFKAMVFAQTLLILPIVVALVCQLVSDAEAAHGEQLQIFGAGATIRSLLLALNERHALVIVVLAAFGRAVAEVGAVMVVGGNIDGFTRVMTTAIALETSKGDLPLALALGVILMAVVAVLNGVVIVVRHWAKQTGGNATALSGVEVHW